MRLTDCDKSRAIANRIVHHPEIYPVMCDDHADPNHDQIGSFLLMQKNLWLLHPAEHVLFMLAPLTMTLYEVHTMIEPEGRGRQAVKDTRKAAVWFFNMNPTCEKVITYVPFFNKQARVFARLVGMKDEGVCTKSFKKDGVLHDQWVLGLEKEALCQR